MIKILLDQNIPEPVTGWLQKEVGDKAVITSTRILNLQRMTDVEHLSHRLETNARSFTALTRLFFNRNLGEHINCC